MSRTGSSSPYWFPAKRHGYGWGLPGRWEGWLSLVLYAVVMTGAGVIGDRSNSVAGNVGAGAIMVVATVALLVVCYRKGEPARWRWGPR